MSVASRCCKSFCVVPCVSFCTGHFVMVPLNMTYLHCLQHSLFELSSIYILNVCCVLVFYVIFVFMCVYLCTGHFGMVPLNLTCLHCLQRCFLEISSIYTNLILEKYPNYGVINVQLFNLSSGFWSNICSLVCYCWIWGWMYKNLTITVNFKK